MKAFLLLALMLAFMVGRANADFVKAYEFNTVYGVVNASGTITFAVTLVGKNGEPAEWDGDIQVQLCNGKKLSFTVRPEQFRQTDLGLLCVIGRVSRDDDPDFFEQLDNSEGRFTVHLIDPKDGLWANGQGRLVGGN
jgi:hypothetical protein